MTKTDEILARIDHLKGYGPGWAGPDSLVPSADAFEEAIAFAGALGRLGEISPPYVSLASDGEINFHWKTSALSLDLGFSGSGRGSYYGVTADGTEYLQDEMDASNALPDGLVTALRARSIASDHGAG